MHDELEQEIFEQLTPLREVPSRQPQAVKAGRERFLAQAAEIRASLPVSKPADLRLSKQKRTFSTLFGLRKEPVPMIAQIGLAIVLAVTLLAGGGGAAVFASQTSQPDEFLYPVKTWSEDVRYDIAASETQKLQLAVEFANRRLEELQAQQMNQQPVNEAVVQRLQLHVEESLQLMTRLNLSEEDQQQIREQLRTQDRLMQQLQLVDGAPEDALLLQVREMMREQLRLAGIETENPVQTQQQNQKEQQNQQQINQPDTSPEAPQPGPGPQTDPMQEGNGPQNQNQSGEPAGVCPADKADCDPVQQQTQQQQQQQNQNQQQNEPQQNQSQQQNQDNDSSSGSSDTGPKKGK